MNRYAVTFDTVDTEAFCQVAPKRRIGTLEEVRKFVSENKDSLLTYHIYRLIPKKWEVFR